MQELINQKEEMMNSFKNKNVVLKKKLQEMASSFSPYKSFNPEIGMGDS